MLWSVSSKICVSYIIKSLWEASAKTITYKDGSREDKSTENYTLGQWITWKTKQTAKQQTEVSWIQGEW